MTQELITMTNRELSRYEIIKNLINGKINGTDASKQIGLSIRQVKNLKSKVRDRGLKGIIHAGRGKQSNRKLNPDLIEKTEKLLKTTYYDFGPTFASEKLEENHNIKINKETLRHMMADLGLRKLKPRKQPKAWHVWRARKDNYGEMQQFDGSYHVWFGNEETCLLLSIDDATGKITHAKFSRNEGVIPVFKFWLEYFEKNGLPVSIYLDKFSTYKVNHKSAVDNQDMITQFQRVSNQTGFKLIFANSPQARGRVERIFKTLQDRLVKELRLAGITAMKEANEFLREYLPRYNVRFAVIPNRKADLHKKINEILKVKLSQIFSVQDTRVIMNDYTIMFENQYFQLNQEQPTTVYKKDTVLVERHLNGEIKLNLKEHYLNYTELPERPKREFDVKLPALTTRKPSQWKPPADHPWRRQFFHNKSGKTRAISIEK